MPNKPKFPTTSISLPPKLREEVKAIAKQQGRPFNHIVEEALNLWLNQL